mgnify:CR=1 FL=1|jgi:hypothetical protein
MLINGTSEEAGVDQDWEAQMMRGDSDRFQNMVTAAVVD